MRAIAEAAAELIKLPAATRGAEIMIPLVGSVQELEIDPRPRPSEVLAEVAAADRRRAVDRRIGTMIELPRAALTAGQIAEAAEFFSFGTNDLTQTTWGFSRDDVEAAFFSAYLEMGIFGVSPFETLDVEGVGRAGQDRAPSEGRATRPDLKVGVCGEHGGDPDSVHFFHHVGLDYVSCSPFRIPGRPPGSRPRRAGPDQSKRSAVSGAARMRAAAGLRLRRRSRGRSTASSSR